MRKFTPNSGYVYILASKQNGTLYVGVTSDIPGRNQQHKEHVFKNSFTDKYNVTQLVWYEFHEYIGDAIKREKEIKHFKREWKIRLIEKDNLLWKDLSDKMQDELKYENL